MSDPLVIWTFNIFIVCSKVEDPVEDQVFAILMGENGMYTKHRTRFVYEYKKLYKQKVKTECTQTVHKSTQPNIDEIEPSYGFWKLAFEIFCF